ncbi:hypothetical protein [Actinoplanes sp. M2I2]|uniref:hypothetical protein n=1 Tax=Actinoplanes sp. M2I2 TaxID=1734444 RepID=UPI002021AAAC|nr:hypothetical protein [Actinoplanes sp. M2I2]
MDDMTSIDAPEVRAMGVAVTGIGERVQRVAAEIRGWEYAGQGAVDGAVLCESQLAGSARFWEITMDGLGAMVRDYGGELRAAAGDFVATDSDAADRLRTAGKPG